MTEDARFEDGRERPLRLKAEDAEDLKVVAALVQDAVFPVSEMEWRRNHRRFALLINRFRWEDKALVDRRRRDFERVQSVLAFDDVMAVRTQGISRDEADVVLSLMTLAFEPAEDGTGRILLTLAGDGAIALEVETVNATLQDVTRPYAAPSRKAPEHPD
ncbi:MAG: DUF2948 family protein [Paracoccaceae bacterium]|nr:DUF2948 family protein [Paracoccaceae bacterium]